MTWGLGWGLTSCGCAYAFYLLSQSNLKEAEFLKSVTKIKNLKDLAQLSGLVPISVTVRGKAGSETPIACKYSNLRGVIVEERVTEEFLKKNNDGRWNHESKLMSSTEREVPWYLDDGTGRVHIQGARNAKGLFLTASGEVFEESADSLVQRTLDSLRSVLGTPDDDGQTVKVLGVKRVESVLPTGTRLTIVGEAVKDSDGTIQIQGPRGGPFYVSQRRIEGLIEDAKDWEGFCKSVSLGLMVVGGCLIAMNGIDYIRKMVSQIRVRRALRRLEQHNEGSRRTARNRENNSNRYRLMPDSPRLFDNEGSRRTARNRENNSNEHHLMPDSPRLFENVGSDRTTLSGEDNSNRDHLIADDSNLCVICLQHEYNAVFVPCGHLCCCIICSSPLTSCPLCRQRISQVVRTFRS